MKSLLGPFLGLPFFETNSRPQKCVFVTPENGTSIESKKSNVGLDGLVSKMIFRISISGVILRVNQPFFIFQG